MDRNPEELLVNYLEDQLRVFEEETEAVTLAVVQAGGILIGIAEDDEEDLDANWEAVAVDVDGFRRMGDPSFRRHFRLTKSCFEALLRSLAGHLIDTGRVQRVRNTIDIPLLMVLWILANPDTFRSVALQFNCQPGVVHFHYSYIIEALREMAPQYIKWPDQAERQTIKAAFEAYSGFPGIVGCIDGTHNVIIAPVVQKLRYRNRHHNYSLNTQVVCDHNLLIRDVHVGEVGSMHDQRVLRRSRLFNRLIAADENFIALDEHLVGDGAYLLMDSLITPFRNVGNLSEQQRFFNYILSRCRARIEHTFGMAFGKWRRMKMLHCINMDLAADHIMACFVLHNFSILHGDVELDLLDPDNGEVLHYLNDMLNDDNVVNDANIEEEAGPVRAAIKNAHLRGIEKRWDIVYNL